MSRNKLLHRAQRISRVMRSRDARCAAVAMRLQNSPYDRVFAPCRSRAKVSRAAPLTPIRALLGFVLSSMYGRQRIMIILSCFFIAPGGYFDSSQVSEPVFAATRNKNISAVQTNSQYADVSEPVRYRIILIFQSWVVCNYSGLYIRTRKVPSELPGGLGGEVTHGNEGPLRHIRSTGQYFSGTIMA